jgi:hypothetical protein
VAVAGDLHHYRRHEAEDGSDTQLITAGGGGAFLHPTIGEPVERIDVGKAPTVSYTLRAEFPDEKISKRLLLRDLLFPFFNPKFGLLSAVLYLVIAWIYRSHVMREIASAPPGQAARIDGFFRALLALPGGFFWIVLVIASFVFFTDTHKKIYKYTAGTIHALTHLGGILWSVVERAG